MVRRRSSTLAVLCAPLALSTLTASAHGDTYSIITIEHTDSETFLGGDNAGDYVILDSQFGPSTPCGYLNPNQACYKTGNALTGAFHYTTAKPTLGVGASWTPEAPVTANLGPDWAANQLGGLIGGIYWTASGIGIEGVFDGTDPFHDKVTGGSLDGGEISANGNVFFIDGLDNDLKVAVDTSTSPVPEPSTLTLLGTGLSGLASLLYRRTRRA